MHDGSPLAPTFLAPNGDQTPAPAFAGTALRTVEWRQRVANVPLCPDYLT